MIKNGWFYGRVVSALTLAPWNSLGGVRSGVNTITSSPCSFNVRIRHSKRFFMPDMCENGLGSTKIATFLIPSDSGLTGTAMGTAG